MTDTTANKGSQVKLVILSMKSRISQRILDIIAASCPRIRYSSFDKIKILASDFNDSEIPAIQLYDVSAEHQWEGPRSKYNWRIALEILLKGDEWNTCSQQDLWNLEYEVKRAILANPNLGIPGVIQVNLLGTTTDLHLLEPYYFSRLDLEVVFYEAGVREC